MSKIQDILKLNEQVRSVAVAGHVHPDGDCVGSCTALWLYLKELQSYDRLDLYLELPAKELCFLQGVSESFQEVPESLNYDLFICCDVSERGRIAVAGELFDRAKRTVSIDHHVSNPGFADENYVLPEASSCAEVLFDLLDYERISKPIAESLYTGIVHDCGVFQYSNTSPHTMRIAAQLMEKGVEFHRIIDDTFNRKTFFQQHILGYSLEKAKLAFQGRCIYSSLTLEEMARFKVTLKDLEGIVAQMRFTEGVEVAVFFYEVEDRVFKVSLRSNAYLDVSSAAAVFGGGGHIRAAGYTLEGTEEEVLGRVLPEIGQRL